MSNERVLKLAHELEQEFVQDPNLDYHYTVNSFDCYARNLPDDLTMETVEKLEDYYSDFVQASSIAFGNIAIEAMADKPDTDMVTGTVTVHNTRQIGLKMNSLVDYSQSLRHE